DPAIGDIRGDANLEIITGSGEYNWPDGGRYVALDSEGTLLWEAFTGDDWAQAPPTLADINLDGSTEIIGGSCSGR
ncbi:MAG: hypothetical protein GWN72_10575, partial [Nitrospinaceae bacterium]|nr:hypothetical protein [Nitrospinaceae bacterium]